MKTSKVALQVALKEINSFWTILPLNEYKFENDPLIQRAAILSLIIIGEETLKVNNSEIKIQYY